jgi:arsenate reductase (glutaredoxin)
MQVRLYGIPNCDTVRRARAWLAAHDVDVVFHDYKKSGVAADRLDAWAHALGWERVLNRKGTSWRALTDTLRDGVVDATSAQAVMRAQPSVIKRPIVEWPSGSVTVGFDEGDWTSRVESAG